jgi:hypothetical protein
MSRNAFNTTPYFGEWRSAYILASVSYRLMKYKFNKIQVDYHAYCFYYYYYYYYYRYTIGVVADHVPKSTTTSV